MYLDQPGLTGLWDRAKAVFAPKSHTHQASEVSSVVTDVQINGASITADGVSNIPIASWSVPGVVKTDNEYGGYSSGLLNVNGRLVLNTAKTGQITDRGIRSNIDASNLDYAVKAAMCDGKGAAWTDAEKASARERMGVNAASWAMAHSMAASKTLTTSSADMPLTTVSGDATLTTLGGLKLAKAGTVLIVASLSLGTGFTANDQVHLRIAVNGAHKGQDVVQHVVSTGYGTVQLTTVLDVAAGDVVTLRAWNATAARGTVQAGNSTRLMVAYL